MLAFLAVFWMAFLVGLSGALVPGPVLTVTIKEAGRRGARAGPLIALGHGITEVGITAALILGVSSFLNDPRVKTLVAVIGGAFLVFMGVTMLLRVKAAGREIAVEAGQPAGGRGTPILLGISTTLSNPYWFGWWGSIGAAMLVTSTSLGYWGVLAFITGHILSDFVWYSVVSYLVSLGLRHNQGLWFSVTFGICGGFLVAVGAGFIVYAARIGGL